MPRPTNSNSAAETRAVDSTWASPKPSTKSDPGTTWADVPALSISMPNSRPLALSEGTWSAPRTIGPPMPACGPRVARIR